MKRRDFISATAALLTAAGAARASDGGVLRLLCPFTPGALHDLLLRTVGNHLASTLKRTVIVENRPGAGGLIAVQALQNAPASGSTTLLQTFTGFVSLPLFTKAATYDPVRDFQPVAAYATGQTVLMVHKSVPARTVGELIAYAKTQPAGLEAPTAGPGGWSDVWMSVFAKRAGINILKVPYKGAAEMALSLQTGQTKVMLSVYNEAFNGQVRAGNLRLLAVTGDRPSRFFPGVPTLSQTIPDFTIEGGWFGLHANTQAPKPELAQIAAAVKAATLDATVRERLAALFVEARYQDAAEFGRSVLETQEVWKKAALELNVQPK